MPYEEWIQKLEMLNLKIGRTRQLLLVKYLKGYRVDKAVHLSVPLQEKEKQQYLMIRKQERKRQKQR